MDLGLQGKRALVSGSTAGIGLAIAVALADEGAAVIVNGRTEARVDDAVRSVRARAPRAAIEGVAADLSTGEGCGELLRRAGDLDILVNNVGVFEARPFAEIADAEWSR